MKKLLFPIFILLVYVLPLQAQQLQSFQQNNKYGYKDQQGNVVVSPKYDMVFAAKQGVAIVKQNGKSGAIDITTGKEFIPCAYDLLFATSNPNQFWVKQDNRTFYINRQGKELTQYGSSTVSANTNNTANTTITLSAEEKALIESLSAEDNYVRMLAAAASHSNPSAYRGETIKQYEAKLKKEGFSETDIFQKVREKLLQMAEIDFYGSFVGVLKTIGIPAQKLLAVYSQPQQQVIRELANYTTRKITTYPSSAPAPGLPWSARGGSGTVGNNTVVANTNNTAQNQNGALELKKGYEATQAKNYTEAFNWYQQSAAKGNSVAMYAVGYMYLAGQGVAKDAAKGKEWLQKAADKGNKSAQEALVKLAAASKTTVSKPGDAEYRQGLIAYNKKDYAEALNWFNKAATQDHENAINYLGWMYKQGFGVTKNYTEAFKWYKKIADKGNANALNNIAGMYSAGGFGLVKNDAEAFKWHKQAAEKGSVNSMATIGIMYANGEGTAQNYPEAMKWYKQAAEKGSDMAMQNIGVMYVHGQGVTKNYVEAQDWFKKAAEKENPDAMYNLGVLYRNGYEGVAKNLQEAKAWYQKAAEKGYEPAKKALVSLEEDIKHAALPGVAEYNKAMDAFKNKKNAEAVALLKQSAAKGYVNAMFELGEIYEFGSDGVAINLQEAFKWYKQAAEKDDSESMFILGEMYESGKGTTKSISEAIKWYQQAANEGYTAGMYRIGLIYKKGDGVGLNYAEAMNWFKKAGEKGYASAMFEVALLYVNGTGVPQNYAEAINWYKQAADKGNTAAMNNLGVLYRNGQGVAKNDVEAFNWYKKAADKGQITAQSNIASMYENGIGTTKNIEEAKKYYKKAADKGDEKAKVALQRLN